jgi:DnaJ-domain-containing protein 1
VETARNWSTIAQFQNGNCKWISAFTSNNGKTLLGSTTLKTINARHTLLGWDVSKWYDQDAIKVAYRQMSLMYQPDKFRPGRLNGMTKEEATARFHTIQEAYELLTK